jgi:hypothetical protein
VEKRRVSNGSMFLVSGVRGMVGGGSRDNVGEVVDMEVEE